MNISKRKKENKKMNMNTNKENFAEAKSLIHFWIHGKGIKKRKNSIIKAICLLRASAYAGYPDAQFELGQLYEDTGYLGYKPRWANYWYEKAARQGHGEACNCLGYNYEHGIGFPVNQRKARSLYEKGARLGSILASRNLKLSYSE